MGGQGVEGDTLVGRRVAGGGQRRPRGDPGEGVPVHLPGHLEEDLLEQMDTRLGRGDVGDHEPGAARGGGEPFHKDGGRGVLGGHHELEGRPARVHVAVEVVAFQEGDVVLDRDHFARSVKAMPA